MFVDDDPRLLAALRAVFRRERASWEMFFATSGDAALAELARTPMDLVVSDHRMPGMDGLELLEKVREVSPGTLRVMLSGTNDAADERIKSVVDQLIGKPCPTTVLRDTVARLLNSGAT